MRIESLAESLLAVCRILARVEANRRFFNLAPKCEPRLGNRGLLGDLGGGVTRTGMEQAMLWLLNQSDGRHGIGDIAATSGLSAETLSVAAARLVERGLLKEVKLHDCDSV
jgi:aminopeptidase-like protein